MYVFIVCVIGLLTAGDMSVTAADSAVDARVYRACGSADSVVCVFTYARHGIIIINPGQHTYYPRADIYIVSERDEVPYRCDKM